MLSSKLKEYRKLCGLTQKQVADALGIDRSTYTYYETGKTTPDVLTLKRLCDLFAVPVSAFLYSDAQEEPLTLHDNGSSYTGSDPTVTMGALTKPEKQLLLLFRQLGEVGKEDLIKKAQTAVEKSIDG